jgi:hypothetical protein
MLEPLSNFSFSFTMRLYAPALLRRTFQQNKSDAVEAGPARLYQGLTTFHFSTRREHFFVGFVGSVGWSL